MRRRFFPQFLYNDRPNARALAIQFLAPACPEFSKGILFTLSLEGPASFTFVRKRVASHFGNRATSIFAKANAVPHNLLPSEPGGSRLRDHSRQTTPIQFAPPRAA